MGIKVVDKAYLSEQFKRYHGVIDPRITTVEGAISTLNGDVNTQGSIQHTVTAAIAGVIDAAPEAFDTLKEISDWIGDHGDTALEMNAAIQSNSSSIETLNGDANTEGSVDYKIANAVPNVETENIDFVTLLRETIVISGETNVTIGNSIALTSSVNGVSWTSSDNEVATVVDGVVTGVSAGEVTITASKSGYNAGTKTVIVSAASQPEPEEPVEEPQTPQVVIEGEASVAVGEDITLTSNAENTTWSSSNDEIATVENGVVHGVSAGEVTITASAEGYTPGTKGVTVTVVGE